MASTKVFAENIVDMKNHADDARVALLDMEAIMDNWIETLTNGMKDIWESDEYDKFRKDFEGDMAERKKAFDAMRRLLRAVDDARLEYEMMESEIAALNINRVS